MRAAILGCLLGLVTAPALAAEPSTGIDQWRWFCGKDNKSNARSCWVETRIALGNPHFFGAVTVFRAPAGMMAWVISTREIEAGGMRVDKRPMIPCIPSRSACALAPEDARTLEAQMRSGKLLFVQVEHRGGAQVELRLPLPQFQSAVKAIRKAGEAW